MHKVFPPEMVAMTDEILAELEVEDQMRELLRRAADKLQDYSEQVNGDLNDSLAMKIYQFIKDHPQ